MVMLVLSYTIIKYLFEAGGLKYLTILKTCILSCVLASVFHAGTSMAGSAYVGLQPQEMTTQAMSALGLSAPSGVIIRNVGENTPASNAGIHQGDVVLSINSKNIATLEQLVAIVSKSNPGDVLAVSLHREGAVVNVDMVIGDWDDATRARKSEAAQLAVYGLTVISLTDKVREQFNVRWDVEGVAVSIVDPAKGISETLKRGDVIVQFNQSKVWLPTQLGKLYGAAREAGRKSVLMLVLRNSGFVYVVLPVR
jgi:serine protease Do